jgi:hypothetical protein
VNRVNVRILSAAPVAQTLSVNWCSFALGCDNISEAIDGAALESREREPTAFVRRRMSRETSRFVARDAACEETPLEAQQAMVTSRR